MNNIAAQAPEPRFLNLEYIFAHFFVLLYYLALQILKFAEWLSHQALLSVVLSIIFLICIIFVVINIMRLRSRKMTHLANFVMHEDVPKMRVNKWDDINKKISSENQADWKSAIIEVDALIDSIIQRIGYKEGESMTERLRSIEPSDLDSLKDVWEAHRIKIKISHEGEAFQLTQEIAKETMGKYKKALKELKYI